MDLDRIRKLAGLPSESVQAPSQLTEKVVEPDTKVLEESTDVDFSTKQSEMLTLLEKAIDDASEESVTLSEDIKEAQADIDALGLTKVGTVIDLGSTIFNVYEDAESDLWFRQTTDAGTIHRTSMVMEDLKAFHAGEDINMRDSDATKKEDSLAEEVDEDADVIEEGKDKEKCKECGKTPCKCKKKEKKGGKPDADGDGVPDWADKKPGKDDKCND